MTQMKQNTPWRREDLCEPRTADSGWPAVIRRQSEPKTFSFTGNYAEIERASWNLPEKAE